MRFQNECSIHGYYLAGQRYLDRFFNETLAKTKQRSKRSELPPMVFQVYP